MYGLTLGLSILFHWFISLSLRQYHSLGLPYFSSKFWNQDVWVLQFCYFSSRLFCLSEGPLEFLYKWRISLSISAKKSHRICDFERDCVESIHQFVEFYYLNNFKASNPWTQMSCQLLRSLTSFNDALCLSVYSLNLFLSILFFLMLLQLTLCPQFYLALPTDHVEKHNWVLHIDPVPFHLGELIY